MQKYKFWEDELERVIRMDYKEFWYDGLERFMLGWTRKIHGRKD